MKRPASITILAVYLLLVFGISFVGSIVGAVKTLPPYNSVVWLVLALPKALAFTAGLAFWRMYRMGILLLVLSVLGEWALAILLNTGIFPNSTVALLISVIFVLLAVYTVVANWKVLRPFSTSRLSGVTE